MVWIHFPNYWPFVRYVRLTKDEQYVALMLSVLLAHDDVIKWKHFPRNWPFVREIHRSPVNFPHKGQWRGALMFSLIYARINDWVNNREAGDLRRQHGHYDVIVMLKRLLKNHMSYRGVVMHWRWYDITIIKDRTWCCHNGDTRRRFYEVKRCCRISPFLAWSFKKSYWGEGGW